jgi:hypothetical protein
MLADYERVCSDPSEKCRVFLGFHAWSKQREILESVRKNPRTAVRSSHGTGKTATAARVVLDWITEGRGIVVTTAPTWHQVEGQLWKEIATAARQAVIPIGGKLTSTRLEIAKDWVAYGLSTDQPERFQGEHSPRLLLVVDEASGVDEAIFQASQGYLTAEGASVLLLGNPTRMAGTFFNAFQPDSRYHKIHISTFDTPRFTGEIVPDTVLREMPTRAWQEEMAQLYGVDDPEYLVRVLGEFASLTGRPYFRRLDRFEPQAPVRIGRFVGDPRKGRGSKVSWHEHTSGPSRLWEAPKAGVRYAIWADVAGSTIRDVWDARVDKAHSREHGSDAYAAYVVSLATGAIVASYHDRLADEKVWAWELARLGRIYHDAEIAVEKVGGFGVAALMCLRDDLAYHELYREIDADSQQREDASGTLGWTTSVTTRPQMLAELEAVLREDPSRLRDAGLLDEMRAFVWNDRGKAEADIGYHDDRVIAAAGAMRLYAMRARSPRPLAAKAAPKRKAQSLAARAPRLKETR